MMLVLREVVVKSNGLATCFAQFFGPFFSSARSFGQKEDTVKYMDRLGRRLESWMRRMTFGNGVMMMMMRTMMVDSLEDRTLGLLGLLRQRSRIQNGTIVC
jgi:hypothetical protein